jgi:hypothetical protein
LVLRVEREVFIRVCLLTELGIARPDRNPARKEVARKISEVLGATV